MQHFHKLFENIAFLTPTNALLHKKSGGYF